MSHQHPKRIAVIGLSTRYAGGVYTPEQMWTHLKSGVDPIRDFPDGRWDRGFLNADHDMKGRSYIFAGGYLDNVDGFDAEFFGISPREARQIDPQQRLLLELAWEALENANLVPEQVAGSATGVFVGLSSRDYGDFGDEATINAYTNLGLALSIASNRLSYVLDLKGPSFTVDTACSSGMVALHQAVESLTRGECEMALVGAANLLLSPKSFIGFAKASMLSPAGRCTPFDADGAGYVRAEGGGVLVLKPLEAAERDGDPILGVIIGSGVNSDGRTMGISLPSADAQAALLERVYSEAGLRPDQVYYVEAHGTGTSVGDPLECEAIARVLGGAQRQGAPLRIGSVKSNVGHLEPAAGIAGLTKVLLSLKHREIPAILHFKTPNPKIDFEGWKLDVVHQHHPLPDSEEPLVFGINSFGFGGTNAHAIVQEYRPSKPPATPAPTVPNTTAAPVASPWQDVMVLSAQSTSGLHAVAQQWHTLLQQEAQSAPAAEAAARWEALRASALHHRTLHPHRLALHADSADEAAARLGEHLAGQHSHQAVVGKAPNAGHAKLAFVYAGNGPQWWGMGREMLAADSTYRHAVEEVDAIFRRQAGWSLIDELMRDAQTSRMAQTEVAQPTLFALQVGLTTVLRAAGLQPHAVMGHSVGEAAAAWASGALSLEQAVHVIHQRSLAQSATAGLGRMAALGVSAEEARAAIEALGASLEIAAINSPSAVTVAGDAAQLEQLCQRLSDAGKFARVLALDYAFHSKAMDGIQSGLAQGLADLQPGQTTTPFVSTVEGKVLDGTALTAEYWWRNVREPVAFEAAARHLLQDQQVTGFIEVGPHPVLRDYLLQNAKARSVNATVLTTLRRPRGEGAEPEVALMWQTVCSAYAHGLGDPARLVPPPAQPVALPTYPWQRQRHWRGEHNLPDLLAPSHRVHPLLGWRPSPVAALWENTPDLSLLPYLADHVIQDAIVYPGAAYVEMALAAGQQLLGDVPVQIEGMEITKPLVLSASALPVVQCNVDAADGTFEILSRANMQATDTTTHIRGRVTHAEPSHRPAPLDIAPLWDDLAEELSAAAHYEGSDLRGMHYGEAFQAVKALRLAVSDEAPSYAAAWIELPLARDLPGLPAYRSHPVLLDGCLQLLISLMGRREGGHVSYIPVRVERLRSFAPLPQRLFCEVTLLRDSDRSGSARFTLRDEQGVCVMILDEARFQKVDFQAGQGGMRLADRWVRDSHTPTQASRGIDLPAPSALQAQVPARTVDASVSARLERLSALYAAEALQALQARAGLAVDASFTTAALQRRAKVVPEMVLLYRAVFDMAVQDGWLVPAEIGVTWAAAPRPAAAQVWQQLMLEASSHAAELMLLAQVGERLPALLVGEAEPVLAAAHERAHPSFETLQDSAPFSAPAYQQVVDAVQALVAHWPADRPLRVLELHAGLGGLTAAVLPHLPSLRTDYSVSDRDPQVLERLQKRFEDTLCLHGLHIDLSDEATWSAQREAFDLVLCGDGLLGSGLPSDQALQRANALLAPGGHVVLLSTAPQRFATLVFGQNPAWWQHDHSPLHEHSAWQALFSDGRWSEALGQDLPSRQRWWAQRAPVAPSDEVQAAEPATENRHWLLLLDGSADNQAFGQAVAQALLQRGQHVRCQTLHDSAATAAAAEAAASSIAADDSAALAALLTTPLHAVVHLAGLHGGGEHALALQPLRCLPLIALAHTTQREDAAQLAKPQLMVVTRGANLGPAASAAIDPGQSPVWGLTRVLSNEHPDFSPRLIDVHAALDAAMAQRLAVELLQRDAETEVLLDERSRWIYRLASHDNAALQADRDALPATPAVAVSNAAANTPAMGVRLQAAAQGGLDALHLQAVPRRAPGRGEVELAVRAAGLNFRDVLWAMNMLPEEAVEHGFSGATVGMECAGEVVAVGEGVTDVAVGDRVIGFASGCFASHVTTSAGAVARIPADLDFEAAATLPTTFLTAQYALMHLARLEPGERVLIHGAAGGVGLAAIQIAKLRGAVVFGTAGNEEKRRLLRLYGVDHVLDSRSLAFADDVMALTGGEGIDVVLNSLAGEAITKNLQILRPFGRLLEIGKRDFYANSRIGLRPFRINLSYFGIDADTLLVERPALARKVFAEVAQLVATGQLRPLPYQALPIGRASKAFRLMQQSRHVGKIVVTVPPAEALPAPVPTGWTAAADGTYLVTGGLGGFGLATARWLVARGARSMALVSRRGASTEEAREGIAAMEAAGATVKAYAADVSDAAQLARVLAEVRATQAPLRGVVHAAMVLDDGPMMLQNRERLMRVLGPKIDGAWHLHQQTLQDRLDCFVLYSSATITIGNPGQGNYVAGNYYLQSLAQWRRAQGLPALSIAWGAIKDVGVVTRTAGLANMLEKRSGLAAVNADEALEELGTMLACGAVGVSVAPFNLQRLSETVLLAKTARFSSLAPAGALDLSGGGRETLAERWANTPADARRPIVIEVLREHLARILGTAATQVDIERPLSDMGLDSLMAVELATSLEREVGRPVSVMQMIQASSAAAVADTLMASLEPSPHA